MDLVEYRRLTVCKSYVNDLSNVFCTYAPVFCKFSVLFYKVWLNVFREIRDIIWEDPFLYEQDPYRAYCIEVGCYTLCFLCVYCHFYETFRGVPRPPSSLKVLVASVCVLVVAIAHLVHEGRTEYFASENLLSPIIIAIKDWIYISMNLLIPWVIMAAKWVYLVLEDQVMSDPLVITTIEWVSLVSEGVDLDKLLHKAVIVVVLLWIYKRRNWQERQDCCKAILILLLVDRVMRLAIKVMARALRELTVVDVIQRCVASSLPP